MAYGNQTSNNYRKPLSSGNTGARPVASAPREAIFSTGLFAPNKEGVKSIGNVQLKEAVTLPAGSYINLYAVDKKDDKSPVFRIQVTPGKRKEQQA